MADIVKFILEEKLDKGLPRGFELFFFTFSVNSVTAAFGATWHHGWIQELKDKARCLPRTVSSP